MRYKQGPFSKGTILTRVPQGIGGDGTIFKIKESIVKDEDTNVPYQIATIAYDTNIDIIGDDTKVYLPEFPKLLSGQRVSSWHFPDSALYRVLTKKDIAKVRTSINTVTNMNNDDIIDGWDY